MGFVLVRYKFIWYTERLDYNLKKISNVIIIQVGKIELWIIENMLISFCVCEVKIKNCFRDRLKWESLNIMLFYM